MAKVIGYNSHGNCLDFSYEGEGDFKGTRFSLAWEIYEGPYSDSLS